MNHNIVISKRVESTDGSASHPIQKPVGAHRRGARLILPIPLCVWYKILVALLILTGTVRAGAPVPAHLPGELSAEAVLNGEYPFPPSHAFPSADNGAGLDKARLGKTPPPGVHPRILISPDELPDLRRRLKDTETGRMSMASLKERIDRAIAQPGWGKELYSLLVAGDAKAVEAGLDAHKGELPSLGHYQPYLMALTMEALRCLIEEDKAGGKQVATAIDTYARVMEPCLDRYANTPLNDDVWRARIPNPDKGNWRDNLSFRDITGYHLLGYAYDFAHPFMSDAQRSDVRRLISKATKGKLWMGARLPHHLRNWNWVAIGTQSPLLALAIEGEDGCDPRVYKLGVEIARDYLTYGISPGGCSTEAVGYTQFGLNWLNPFVIAAARRGEDLLTKSHFRTMLGWYLNAMAPSGGHWLSHGDGGHAGPSLSTLAMWKYFLPSDPKADYLWQNLLLAAGGDPFKDKPHLVEALLWSSDGLKDASGKPVDYSAGAKLNEPLTWFDPVRSSLIARNAWSANATAVQFECRTDSLGSSHEHADRGSFCLSADGREWAKDNFRSVETRYHNGILVDGGGQGFWPGPGKWLGLEEKGNILIAACDAKEAYDWMWPKEIETEPADFVRFGFERWKDYGKAAAEFHKRFKGLSPEPERRDAVKAQWDGFADKGGGPRLWDEDGRPVRYPHNPVQRAFRTLAFSRGDHPYLLIVDDFQKDGQERLYEWLMQTGLDTEMASFSGSDIILCDATAMRDANGVVKPAKGDRQLLVRILNLNEPKLERHYQTRPSTRLETFERRDTLVPEMTAGALSGGRSFALDKRLVIASRAVAPDFKILLFPHRAGDELPVTNWNDDRTVLTVGIAGRKETYKLTHSPEGRTLLKVLDAEK